MTAPATLAPYLPRFALQWLADAPEQRHRRLDGTLVFADISGFTALTERLARSGRAGAEEMGEVLNATFTEILAPAYGRGAGLLKWGGDAVLLLFEGPGHDLRAAHSCREMLAVLRRAGRIRSSGGPVTLRMSIGVHTGPIDAFMVGTVHRELIIAGPAATAVTTAEKVADAGEVVCSPGAAAALGPALVTADDAGRLLLTGRLPRVGPPPPSPAPRLADAELAAGMPPTVAGHLGGAESDHRPVATVFVEFAGLDDLLASEGPEVVAEALSGLIDVADAVAEAQGVCFLASDVGPDGGKLLLSAGAPVASGDHERRAISAARSIVDAGSRLRLRGGVSAGRVFAGDYGPPWRRTYSTVGDTVNLAARLMAKAAPGQVVASADAVAGSRVRFPLTALEPFMVKGKSAPITAYTVDGLPGEDADSDGADRPIVGRDAELAALRAAWASVGERGAVVDLVGPAGIGKTRLMNEWRRDAPAQTLVTRCDVHAAAVPYGVLRSLVATALERAGWTPDAVPDRLAPLLAGGQRRWLPLLAPVLGDGVTELPADLAELDDGYRFDRLAEMVVALLAATLHGPAELLVGDLHHADGASVDLLRRAVPAIAAHPWLLVVTRRPEGPDLLAGCEDVGTRLELRPLTDDDAARLVDALTDDDPLPPVLARQIVARCAGNPLWIAEFVAASRAGATELPDSLEAAVAITIDRLPARERAVLRSLSVLGGLIDPALVEPVLGPDGLELSDDVLAGLHGLIEEQHGDLAFVQASVRDAAHASLPYRRRRELHRRAAAAIAERLDVYGDGVLSLHLEAAGELGVAAEHALRAGCRARDAFAPAEAAEHFARAVRCASAAPTHRAVLVDAATEAGRTLVALGQTAEAAEAYALARRRATTPARRLRALAGLGEAHGVLGDYPAVLKDVGAALALTTRSGLARGGEVLDDLLALHTHAVVAQLRIGHPERGLRWGARGLELTTSDPEASRRRRAELHRVRADCLMATRSGTAAAAEELARGLEALQGMHAPQLAARLTNMLGINAYFAGDLGGAAAHYAAAAEQHRSVGCDLDAAIPALNAVEVLGDLGRWDDAVAEARQPLRTLRAARYTSAVTALSIYVGVAHGRARRTDEALRHLDDAISAAEALGERGAAVESQVRRVEALLCGGRLQACRCQLEGVLADPVAAAPYMAALLRCSGVARARAGEPTEVCLAELRRSAEVARASGSQLELAFSLAALAPLDPTVAVERDFLLGRLGVVATPPLWGVGPSPAAGGLGVVVPDVVDLTGEVAPA